MTREKFNFLWKVELTLEEYEAEMLKNPNLDTSYSLQEEIAKKYDQNN